MPSVLIHVDGNRQSSGYLAGMDARSVLIPCRLSLLFLKHVFFDVVYSTGNS